MEPCYECDSCEQSSVNVTVRKSLYLRQKEYVNPPKNCEYSFREWCVCACMCVGRTETGSQKEQLKAQCLNLEEAWGQADGSEVQAERRILGSVSKRSCFLLFDSFCSETQDSVHSL